MLKALWLYLIVIVALVWAAVALRPPVPLAASAPPSVFSAGRAMDDVRAIALRPHPTGSEDIGRVRAYVLQRLAGLGLGGEVHVGQGVRQVRGDASRLSAGSVQNLIGILPGRDRSRPALLVMSHYDTVPNSPGAADDTAGVASALEIARLMKTGPVPERDVIFLFTDGEEAGLLGADAFFNTDPLARRVGVVVNMESRGGGGRASMFETGPGSAGLIALMARTVGTPNAISLSSAIYHLLPNDTDFTHAVRHGLPGLNYAFLDDLPAYHSPLSTPARVDPGALQDMGNQAGAMVRALAAQTDLPTTASGGDEAYDDVLGLVFLHYPAWAGWLILGLSAAAVVVTALRVRRAGRTTPMQVLRGAALFGAAGAATGLVMQVIGAALGLGDYWASYATVGQSHALIAAELGAALTVSVLLSGAAAAGRGRVAVIVGALGLAGAACGLKHGLDPVALTLAVVASGLAAFALARPIAAWSAWIGALATAMVLVGGLQAASPAMAPPFMLPLAVAALAALVCSLSGDAARGRGLVAAALVATPGLALAFYAGGGLFTAIGAGLPVANLATWLMAAPLLAPMAHAAGRVLLGGVLALLGAAAAVVALVLVAAGPSAAHPQPTEAFYLSDPGMKLWVWCSRLTHTPWSDAVLRLDGGALRKDRAPPLVPVPADMAPARRIDVLSPVVGGDRVDGRLLLRAAPTRRGQTLVLMLRPTVELRHVRLNGIDVPLATRPGEWSLVSFEAPPPEGVTLAFDTPEHGQVAFAAAEMADGWPTGVTPPPMPASVIPVARSGMTVAVARLIAAW